MKQIYETYDINIEQVEVPSRGKAERTWQVLGKQFNEKKTVREERAVDLQKIDTMTVFVRANDLVYRKGNRYMNPCILKRGRNVFQTSIRATTLFMIVQKKAKQFIPISILQREISKYDPEATELMINQYIEQLIQNKYLIIKGKEINSPSKQENVNDIDGVTIKRENAKQNYLDDSRCLQVEQFFNIFLEIIKYAPVNQIFSEYKKKFLKKYGAYTEVPLLFLLDESVGIGKPEGWGSDEKIDLDKKKEWECLKAKIKKQVQEAIEKRIPFILLQEEDFQIKKQKEENLPNTEEEFVYDFLTKLFYCKAIAIREEERLFLHGENTRQPFLDMAGMDYLCAILVEGEQGDYQGYTMNQQSEMLYEICLEGNPSGKREEILISDLYIGLEKGRFYIKSKQKGKKIHILNHKSATNDTESTIARFLKGVSKQQLLSPFELLKELCSFEEFFYIPEIRFKDITLLPGRFCFSDDSMDLFMKNIQKWKEVWGVPKYILVQYKGAYLSLNLECFFQKRVVYEILKKQNQIDVFPIETWKQENPSENRAPGQEEDINDYKEITIFFAKKGIEETERRQKRESIQTYSKVLQNRSRIFIQDKRRNLFPGQEGWYYYKLYTSKDRIMELIQQYIYPFCECRKEQKEISQYFWNRCIKPKLHLKLWVQVRQQKMFNRTWQTFFQKLHEDGLVYEFQMCNYERKIEQYGGVEIIQEAEQFFCADSHYVGQIFDMVRKKDFSVFCGVAVLSILNFINQFQLTFAQQERLLSFMEKRTQQYRSERYQEEYKACEKFMMCFEKKYYGELLPFLRERNIAIFQYRNAMEQQDKKGLLSDTKQEILSHLVHSFCNRCKESRSWENFILQLSKRSLYLLNH